MEAFLLKLLHISQNRLSKSASIKLHANGCGHRQRLKRENVDAKSREKIVSNPSQSSFQIGGRGGNSRQFEETSSDLIIDTFSSCLVSCDVPELAQGGRRDSLIEQNVCEVFGSHGLSIGTISNARTLLPNTPK